MNNLLLLAALATSTSGTVANRAPALSASAEQDLKCFTLALVGASVVKDQDPDKLKSAIAESWYFLGRLDAKAPGIDLNQAARRAFDGMNGNPKTKEVGATCDTLFISRASVLKNMGTQSQNKNP